MYFNFMQDIYNAFANVKKIKPIKWLNIDKLKNKLP